jgi:hypothetical protein
MAASSALCFRDSEISETAFFASQIHGFYDSVVTDAVLLERSASKVGFVIGAIPF